LQDYLIYFKKKVMDDLFEDVRYFVLRIIAGEDLNSPEDLQFYQNNKIEIEALLREYDDDEFPLGDINFDDEGL
tara:strand:- start:1282 stop:1503 length:222 start_codon:yes stop_codon:yes gene_type:complete